MNKYITLIIALLLLSISAKAQFSVNYTIGYGQHLMGDMKDIAESSLTNTGGELGAKLKLTSNFPLSIVHTGEICYQINKHEFGITGAYMSSGAKFAYSDYSGKYNSRLVTNAFKLGGVYKYYFYETNLAKKPLSVFASISTSVVKTDVVAYEEIELYQAEIHETEKEKIIGNRFGFSALPMVGGRLLLFKHLFVLMSAGLDIEMGCTITPVHRVDWSGMRLNAGIGFKF